MLLTLIIELFPLKLWLIEYTGPIRYPSIRKYYGFDVKTDLILNWKINRSSLEPSTDISPLKCPIQFQRTPRSGLNARPWSSKSATWTTRSKTWRRTKRSSGQFSTRRRPPWRARMRRSRIWREKSNLWSRFVSDWFFSFQIDKRPLLQVSMSVILNVQKRYRTVTISAKM